MTVVVNLQSYIHATTVAHEVNTALRYKKTGSVLELIHIGIPQLRLC